MLTKIYHKIKEYNTIIIHRHTKPDGDALGSQIGLKEAILATFPNKCVKVVGDISERYSWIGSMDEIDDEYFELYEHANLNNPLKYINAGTYTIYYQITADQTCQFCVHPKILKFKDQENLFCS